MKKYDVIIIGGGVSGMTLATMIKNKNTLIIESNERIGKKLLSTGNGKCNLINKNLSLDKYNDKDFAKIFDAFDYAKIEAYYERLGLMLRYDSEGRGYPISECASTVLDAYRRAIAKNDIDVVTGEKVESIIKDNGYIVCTNKSQYLTTNVVVATGSDASFGIDSLGLFGGYGAVNEYRPSLVPIVTETSDIKGLNGVRIKCLASLEIGGNKKYSEQGEILFKSFGLSGIAIFNLSCAYARAYQNKLEANISLNLLSMDEADVVTLLEKKKSSGFNSAEELLEGIFHKMLIQNILAKCKLTGNQELSQSEIQTLAKTITDYKIKIKGLGDKSLAQVMCGGLAKQSINNDTLELKGAKNMFAIGECVDMDGVSGGYNIMWAVASALRVAEVLNQA